MGDPVTIGVLASTALSMAAEAAVKGTVGEAAKEAYKTLKSRVARWAGADVEALEKAPASGGRRSVVAEAVDAQPADEQAVVGALAEQLIAALKRAGGVGTFVDAHGGDVDVKNIYEAYDRETPEELQTAKAKIKLLQEEIQKKDSYIAELSFPYAEQFTPKKLVKHVRSDDAARHQGVSQIDPIFSHRMFSVNQIYLDSKVWEFDPKITKFDFADWFDLEQLKKIPGLNEISAEWRTIFGEDIACWKGSRDYHVTITPESHDFVRHMYPFVWVARIPRDRINTERDHISYLVARFLTWINKLAEAPKTSFSLDRITIIENRIGYVVFDFCLRDVEAIDTKGRRFKNYHLFRQVISQSPKTISTSFRVENFGPIHVRKRNMWGTCTSGSHDFSLELTAEAALYNPRRLCPSKKTT